MFQMKLMSFFLQIKNIELLLCRSNILTKAYLIIKKSGENRLYEALATIIRTVPTPAHKGIIIK